ncbi:hypothetical protein HUJ04_002597 [Dendroctonus ponderosae]|uniref:Kinesin-like protein n=2 Tax=Dendroctonus ponderosae TaxID=77166 RepID=A0AAR5PGI1_DENPD|nr:hypothetical protein HUJ04_002597 [Dendroctonus ponderosae]
MLVSKLPKVSTMVRSKNIPNTPRQGGSVNRRLSGKVVKILSRPVSGTPSSVSAGCNIKVVVRVRPPNAKEQESNQRHIIRFMDDKSLIFDPKEDEVPFFYHGVPQKTRDLLKKEKKDIALAYDRVFDFASTNVEVFDSSTKSLIQVLMDGCNCSVFAYGATGAGKTFTMIGNPESPGITYLTMEELFIHKEKLSVEREFELMVTYIEVYNELVKDLLNPGSILNLREDSKYGVMIPGVKVHKIKSPEELFSLLEQGNKRRTQHPTDANAESSRSHAVFQVYIQMTIKANREIRRAKLSMIDLAGSERGSATGFVGARFKEGANINKSLLALGNCINSLADGLRHVPYRDSKLTRLLKDSLGGNCHTIMIANVSPSSIHYDDTYNTLKYATRAKNIKSIIKKNIVNAELHADKYIKMVDDLQSENAQLKSELATLKKQYEELQTKFTQVSNGDICAVDNCNSQDAGQENIAAGLLQGNQELKKQNAALENVIGGLSTREASTQQIDPKLLQNYQALVQEKKDLMDSEFQLRSGELVMSLKRELKQDTQERLSVFYLDTPTKDDRRRKLIEQVQRSEKKEQTTNVALCQNRKLQDKSDENLQECLDRNPELVKIHELSILELEKLRLTYDRDLEQKRHRVLLDDHHDKCQLIAQMTNLMKQLFLSVGGRADAPVAIIRKYEELVAIFEGKKSLTWGDGKSADELDSGLSSTTSVNENAEEQNRATKRKIESETPVRLDSTFVCNTGASSSTTEVPTVLTPINTLMVVKGSKSPAVKRLATVAPLKSRFTVPKRPLLTGTQNHISPKGKFMPKGRDAYRFTTKASIRPDSKRELTNVRKVMPQPSSRPKFM